MQTDSLSVVSGAVTGVLNRVYLGNPASRWLLAGIVLAVVFAVLVLVRRMFAARMQRATPHHLAPLNDFALAVVRATRYAFLFLVAVLLAASVLVLSDTARSVIGTAAIVIMLLQVALWGTALIGTWIRGYTTRRASDLGGITTINALGILARMTLWSVILLLVLANLGVEVTALVASLGIGGIAVALALQNILGDLFASLSIVIDKPFLVGHTINVGEFTGTVEDIGLKSTRLRSVTGEQVIIANGDLLQSRIRNYKRMTERRVMLVVGVEYDTPQALVERVPELAREAVGGVKDVRFERAHFRTFGPSSLDYEIIYWVLSADYTLFMDVQQKVNFALLSRFRDLEIAFAFPTQTLVVRGNAEEDAPHLAAKPASPARK